METQLHPLITQAEIKRISHQLIRFHYPEQKDCTLTLEHTLTEDGKAIPRITSSVVLKGSFITDLFGESLKTTLPFRRVSDIDGYPFDVIVAYPPYSNWFPRTYPLPDKLPIEVLFMYFAFQLLQTDGLLVMISDSDRSHWPEDQIHKIGKLIDVYLLPAAFSQPAGNEILVYRKKPTDAVRYE